MSRPNELYIKTIYLAQDYDTDLPEEIKINWYDYGIAV